MAILRAKITSPQTLRTVLLEGKRIMAPQALELGIVDDLAPDGQATLEKARALGESVAPKAQAQAWGLIKAGMYQQALVDIALDKGNDGLGMHVSAAKPKL